MNGSDATRVLPALAWSDPRVHLLDDTWLLTIFAALLATVVPWLVSALDINFIAVCLGLLALGAIHIALTTYGRPARTGERRPVLSALHIAGILVLGFVWLHAGGLQNPAFLLVFALPVVGAIFLSRWQPYAMALLAVAVAGAVALAQAPELRWYVPGLSGTGAWLTELLGERATTSMPFPGFYAPSAYFVVLLEVFAILILACAIAAEYLGAIFERLHTHVETARAEAEQGQELWATLIEDLPAPALLVDADTLHVVCASEQAAEFVSGETENGEGLFDRIRFSYPDVVQELITGVGGVAPLSMIRVGERLRATRIRVRHISKRGRRFGLVVIEDLSEAFTLRTALDVAGQAVVAIDARDRVLAFNKPAQALFASMEAGRDASALMTASGLPHRWWEPGLGGRRKMHVEIGARIYQVTCSAAPLPGEEERLYVVAFLPVAHAGGDLHTSANVPLADATRIGVVDSTLVSRR